MTREGAWEARCRRVRVPGPRSPAGLSARLLDAFVWLGLLCCGCVTGGQVCVETAHGYGPGYQLGLQRDSVGASACVTLERRP